MSKIFNHFYKTTVKSKKLVGIAFRFVREVLVKVFNDPEVLYNVRGHDLYMPMSHEMPFYVEKFPLYDSIILRISSFLRGKVQNISYIDVGANIGDTIVAINPISEDKIIAVEPEPRFNSIAHKNLHKYNNVEMLNVLCSSERQESPMKLREKSGTASFIEDTSSMSTWKKTTIDQIVSERNMTRLNFLKVDTDGHDFEVLRGSYNTLKKFRPVVFFECDWFGNKDFLKNIFSLCENLCSCGYKSVLIYDNFGYYIGKFDLSDMTHLYSLLLYRLVGGVDYFDILTMNEEYLRDFEKVEIEFFNNLVKDKVELINM